MLNTVAPCINGGGVPWKFAAQLERGAAAILIDFQEWVRKS